MKSLCSDAVFLNLRKGLRHGVLAAPPVGSLSTTGVQVMLEDDTTQDGEIEHIAERVDYLAIQGDGM